MNVLNSKKKREIFLAVVLGTISLTSYLIAFANQTYITQNFTSGGWNAFLPLAIAFFFSFLHGTFASNVLIILGITASKKSTA